MTKLHLVFFAPFTFLFSSCDEPTSKKSNHNTILPSHTRLEIELTVNKKSVEVEQCILTERMVHKGSSFSSGRLYGWAGRSHFVEFSFKNHSSLSGDLQSFKLVDREGETIAHSHGHWHPHSFVAGSSESKLRYIALSLESIPLLALQKTKEIVVTFEENAG